MTELRFSKRGVIKDSSFIYIEWLDKDKPTVNEDIHELIIDLDSEVLYEGHSIDDCLPFLTFKQAETLFKALKDTYGEFTFKMMSLASSDKGKPSIANEPKVAPFVIDETYSNLLTPLMESSLIIDELKAYSYEDLNYYFTDPSHGIMKDYASSLGVSRATLPYFPEQGRTKEIAAKHEKKSNKAKKVIEEKTVTVDLLTKVALALATLGFVFGSLGVAFGLSSKAKIQKLSEQTLYLYEQQNKERDKEELTREADVFARHFLADYFSGDKKALTPYLSSGNAKYTQPDKTEYVVSSLLEKSTYLSKKSVRLTYVLSLKDEETKYRNIRLSFDVKKEGENRFVVISEPIQEEYLVVPTTTSK